MHLKPGYSLKYLQKTSFIFIGNSFTITSASLSASTR